METLPATSCRQSPPSVCEQLGATGDWAVLQSGSGAPVRHTSGPTCCPPYHPTPRQVSGGPLSRAPSNSLAGSHCTPVLPLTSSPPGSHKSAVCGERVFWAQNIWASEKPGERLWKSGWSQGSPARGGRQALSGSTVSTAQEFHSLRLMGEAAPPPHRDTPYRRVTESVTGSAKAARMSCLRILGHWGGQQGGERATPGYSEACQFESWFGAQCFALSSSLTNPAALEKMARLKVQYGDGPTEGLFVTEGLWGSCEIKLNWSKGPV
ncbi:hypothetical protein AAFF_G00321000 [Aldrovandia affinis]|uniref:Uncharacterized protein n=1 Tax=Aldrovandia affinis TaxID=143900 RepID=A0AAD7R7C6_9TELE|nr:hypothetical protein AAFF_G00321000 [Aldrovandia affinis]